LRFIAVLTLAPLLLLMAQILHYRVQKSVMAENPENMLHKFFNRFYVTKDRPLDFQITVSVIVLLAVVFVVGRILFLAVENISH
jgi:hypothetical protein